MKLVLVTAPTLECVSIDELKTHLRVDSDSNQDNIELNAVLSAARGNTEDICRRALLTQTWDYYLDGFPSDNFIKLPKGNLQTVTHIKYKKCDWLSAADDVTLTLATDYLVETNGAGCGRVVLPYGATWPSETFYPSNPVVIRFVCGWTTVVGIPANIRAAVKLISADLYANREQQVFGMGQYQENKTVQRLLASARLYDEFI